MVSVSMSDLAAEVCREEGPFLQISSMTVSPAGHRGHAQSCDRYFQDGISA